MSTADQVTVGNGSSGLLNQMIVAYVDPGDEVLYPWRSFEAYPVFTSWMDGEVGDRAADARRSNTTPTDWWRRSPIAHQVAVPGDAQQPTGVATTTADLAAIIERVPER